MKRKADTHRDTADIDQRISEARETLRDLYAERASIRKAAREKDKYAYIPELRKRALALWQAGHPTRSVGEQLDRHPATIIQYVSEEALIEAQRRFPPIPPRPKGYIGRLPDIDEWSDKWWYEIYQTAKQIEAEWNDIRKTNKKKVKETEPS